MPNNSPKLIAVTGPTGAGKTTFINLVCGSNFKVNQGLQSCTEKVQAAKGTIAGESITLIDTPGFDDTHKSQADILKDIADFLEQTYESGIKLTGLIYMHRISDFRMGGIARENFRLFSKICGDDAMKNVLIVTTMWEDVPEALGVKRERELVAKSIFFKDAVDSGARMVRHLNNHSSAASVVLPFLSNVPEALQMQRELVDDFKVLPDTTAGSLLQMELAKQAAQYQEELVKLQREMQDVLQRKETDHKEEVQCLKDELKKQQEMLKAAQDDTQKLQRERKRRVRKRHNGVSVKAQKILGIRAGPVKVIYVTKYRRGAGCLDDGVFEL